MHLTTVIHEITSVFETNEFKVDLNIFVLRHTQHCTSILVVPNVDPGHASELKLELVFNQCKHFSNTINIIFFIQNYICILKCD